jgi:hypothetical protein
MPSPALTVKEAFEQLRAQFEQGSHQHPGLWHFWMQVAESVRDEVLQETATQHGQPLVEVTKWPNTEGKVDYSCFFGASEQLEHFKRLAEQARGLLTEPLSRRGITPPHTTYQPHIAWLVDLYDQATTGATPGLSARLSLVGEWWLPAGGTRVILVVDDEEGHKHLGRLQKKWGPPLAGHRHWELTHDVFTASAAMIQHILAEAAANPDVRDALGRPVQSTTATAGPIPCAAPPGSPPPGSGNSNLTKAGPGGVRQRRPAWVNQADLIGPCSHTAFAKLLDLSGTHLYRLIKQGEVWKERGPSAKKFYFHHRDPTTQRRLREVFERSRTQRRG